MGSTKLNLNKIIMKLIRFLTITILLLLTFSAFSQSPVNASTLRVTSLRGNMKANGTSLVTADTLQLKSDTLRGDVELFVRDSTLLEIIEANSATVSFGTDNQVPYTNAAGDDFDYSANLLFNGTNLIMVGTGDITGSLDVDTWNIDGQTATTTGGMTLTATDGNMTLNVNGVTNRKIIFDDGGEYDTQFSRWDFNNRDFIDVGNIYLSGQLVNLRTTDQLVLGTTNTTTISSTAPAASRTYTIPDAGSASNFALTATGVANTIPYWSSTTRLANDTDLTFNGATLAVVNSGSSAAQTITKSGSGNGLTITNSGSGKALQAGNITVDANTIGSTTGDIILTPDTGDNILLDQITVDDRVISVNIGGNNGLAIRPSGSGNVELFTPTTGTGSLLPGTDNTNDIGRTSVTDFRWKDVYISGGFYSEKTTNQIILGTGVNQTILTAPATASSVTYTIPDMGQSTNFIMGAGANTITNSSSTVPLTITKSGSGNGVVINDTGSGSGLVVTNSGGGVALQAGNITLDASVVASTSGDLTLTPTTNVDISSGALEMAGTEVISSGRAISGTTGTFTGLLNRTATNLDGSAPPEIQVRNNGNGSAWTAGAVAGRYSFYSADGSGAGAGNRSAVDMIVENTIGSLYGLSLKVGNATGLIEGVIINSSKQVGIDITPSEKLHVNGNGLFVGGITATTGAFSGDLTLSGGKRILGANGRSIMLNKTVTLTDATATTIATITLPSGSNLNGGYVVYVDGMIINTGTTTSSAIGNKAYRGYVVWGQDNGATSSEGFKTANTLESASGGDQLAQRDIGTIVISGSRSGTDNQDHVIQLNVDGTGGTTASLYFIGTISIHWYNFSSFTAN